ncbi:MAG: PH domain-containing protein, partial [Candidatus Dormibacteraceae bacterium]
LGAAILCLLLLVGCRLLRLPAALWVASFAVFPLAALLAWDRARSLGHTVQDGWLVLRIGSLVRRTSIIRHEGVIGWNVRQSFFQRRLGLVSLAATTAAGRQHYEAEDVTPEAALRVCEEVLPGMLRPFLTPGEQASALPPTMGGLR